MCPQRTSASEAASRQRSRRRAWLVQRNYWVPLLAKSKRIERRPMAKWTSRSRTHYTRGIVSRRVSAHFCEMIDPRRAAAGSAGSKNLSPVSDIGSFSAEGVGVCARVSGFAVEQRGRERNCVRLYKYRVLLRIVETRSKNTGLKMKKKDTMFFQRIFWCVRWL